MPDVAAYWRGFAYRRVGYMSHDEQRFPVAATVTNVTTHAHADIRRSASAAARLDEYVAKAVAAAPPLTDAQRGRLAELLRPARQYASDKNLPR